MAQTPVKWNRSEPSTPVAITLRSVVLVPMTIPVVPPTRTRAKTQTATKASIKAKTRAKLKAKTKVQPRTKTKGKVAGITTSRASKTTTMGKAESHVTHVTYVIKGAIMPLTAQSTQNGMNLG